MRYILFLSYLILISCSNERIQEIDSEYLEVSDSEIKKPMSTRY